MVQEDEPVTGIVQIGNNISDGDTIFLFGFLSKIIAFNCDTNEIRWNKSFGLNKNGDVFIWKMISNSLQQEEVSGVYVSLSNGTIFEISQDGLVLWTKSLGILAISSLVLVEAPSTPEVPFYIVSGGDNNQVTWLTPEGNITESHSTSSEITIIVARDGYSLVGTRSGDISVYNGTDHLWNKSIGNTQVLAGNLNRNLVIAYSYGSEVIIMNLTKGSIEYTKDFGLLTYNSIQILKQEDDQAYLFKNNGELVVIRVSSGGIAWENSDIPSYITNIQVTESTGDSQEDIVVSTISGYIFVINQSTGDTLYSEKVSQEQISYLITSNLNDDAITDLIFGTLDGKIVAILGSDLTPPIISELKSVKISYDKYNITVTTNEPVTAHIKYGLTSIEEIKHTDNTSSLIHTFILENLVPEVTYLAQVLVNDSNGNIATSEVFTIATGAASTPFPLVELSLSAILVFGVIGTGYILYERRTSQEALRSGEEALKDNDYTTAIKYFYKAKAKDRVIDVAQIMVLHPELAHEMSEIKKIKEIKEYITAAQEIVEKAQK